MVLNIFFLKNKINFLNTINWSVFYI